MAETDAAPSIALPPRQTDGWQMLAAIERVLEAERDQLALWVPVGFGAGIAGWFALPGPTGWIGLGIAAAGVGLAALLFGGTSRLGRAVTIFALAMLLGLVAIWTKADWVAAPRIDRPKVVALTGIVEAAEPRPATATIRLLIAPDTGNGLPPRVRINVDAEDLPAPPPAGSRVAVRARLLPPAPPMVPGGYDFARVAWFERIGATGRALDPPVIVAPDGGSSLADIRTRLTAHIEASIKDAGEGGIAASFVTGDQGGIPEDDNEALRRAGLAHLLSVSGLHVTAVVGAVMLLTIRLLALSRRLALHAPLPLIAAGAGALAGIGYTLLTGSEVPTVRSCIAALLVLGGIALGREAITLRLVAAGALIVLVFWPEALAGPSFQLSFAAIAALVAFHEHPKVAAFAARRDEGIVLGGARILLMLLASGVVIEAALSPIALFHFHKAGLYGAAANIVAIPLTTFVVMPAEAIALALDLVGLGAPIWWLVGKALGLLLWIAHVVADAPGSVANLPSMPRGAFALMATGGLWIVLWRTRLRRWGVVPLAMGAIWSLLTPPPDILVTGDGRHVAVRDGRDGIAILRDRAGDYVRDVLGEASGVEGEAPALELMPFARCSADLCAVDVSGGGRTIRLLATRSRDFVDIRAMTRACAAADIVVSDRRLPRTCHPRWLKADAPFLRSTGGLAIRIGSGEVESVAEQVGLHPWGSFAAGSR
ncbi:ComEC/Rec2 family competence protein [Sphingomonas montanisoli]|uniref:ComEC family competence protein n=1 Tax=Sphingomonas montanisoli TaxID=2606412 RepID=A0A5D9C4K5_9SPHN|nr:ComEC/Rec2 family competence protein [Sphingomonas montanisoli]TZG26142.1 ComEC family competence protein [Sphingomonas montanisoli]